MVRDGGFVDLTRAHRRSVRPLGINRPRHLWRALHLIKIIDPGQLYSSLPMYLTDQLFAITEGGLCWYSTHRAAFSPTSINEVLVLRITDRANSSMRKPMSFQLVSGSLLTL